MTTATGVGSWPGTDAEEYAEAVRVVLGEDPDLPYLPELPGRGAAAGMVGRTLAIWGYGKIGRMVAGYGKAFGMRVLVWGREASSAAALADGYQAAQSKQQFFAEADVLSLHLRLNDATRGIVEAADLALMPHVLIADCKQDAHRLGSGEGQIESCVSRRATTTTRQRLARARRATGKQRAELAALRAFIQTQRLCSPPNPLSGHAVALGVVVVPSELRRFVVAGILGCADG